MEELVGLLPEPWSAIVLIVLVSSAIALWRLEAGEDGPWIIDRARDRFVFGVPWGTLSVMALLLASYLLLQDGWSAWDRPVAYPFIAWSYFYPLGQLTAGFAHASPGHLLGNLLGTAVLGTIAEYAWGHYPTDRSPWPRRPWVRAFVVLPAATILVALVTTTFAWGSVIGFSGVVFAFAGFAVIRYPLATVIGYLVQNVILVVGRALSDPVVVHEVSSGANPPSWAGVAFQGHALGFLLGALAGLWLVYRRRSRGMPGPFHVWLGVMVLGAVMGLWTIWSAPADDVFVLYRGAGVAGLLVLAIVLAGASRASTTPLGFGISARHVLVCLVCFPVVAMSVAAVPMGLSTVVPPDPSANAVSVDDYEVSYDVDRQMVWQPGIDVSGLPGASTNVTRSGLFVTSESRQLHIQVQSSDELARSGGANVTLGGLGWRARVDVLRTGWTPAGNDSVYRVAAIHDGQRHTLYTSPPKQADVRVGERRFELAATATGFGVTVVDSTGETQTAWIPADGDAAMAGDVRIHRDGDRLLAESDGTRVVVASRD